MIYVYIPLVAFLVVIAQAVAMRMVLHPIVERMEQAAKVASLATQTVQMQMDRLAAGQAKLAMQAELSANKAKVVADELIDTQRRADQHADDPPGAAADAASQSPPKK